jgi:hypothetical protein
MLERALEPFVAREIDVVRNLLGGDHRASLNLVMESPGYLVI